MSDILDLENGGEEEQDLFGEDVGREDELEFGNIGEKLNRQLFLVIRVPPLQRK